MREKSFFYEIIFRNSVKTIRSLCITVVHNLTIFLPRENERQNVVTRVRKRGLR